MRRQRPARVPWPERNRYDRWRVQIREQLLRQQEIHRQVAQSLDAFHVQGPFKRYSVVLRIVSTRPSDIEEAKLLVLGRVDDHVWIK